MVGWSLLGDCVLRGAELVLLSRLSKRELVELYVYLLMYLTNL